MEPKPSASPACRGEKKTKWTPRHPRNLNHLSASVMSSSRGDWATCYSLCDTNILHYTLRHWDYSTSLSRPSLTRWLITWFLFTKYLKSNEFLTCLLKYPHALNGEKNKEKMGYFSKASFVDCKSSKRKSKLQVSSAAKKHTNDKRTSAKRKEPSSESLESERKQKVQGWLPHTAQTKMQAKFSWDSKYNKYKNKQ